MMLSSEQRAAAIALAQLGWQTFVGAQRMTLEQRALGSAYRVDEPEHNRKALDERALAWLGQAQEALGRGAERTEEDTWLYEGLLRYRLATSLESPFRSLLQACLGAGLTMRRVAAYQDTYLPELARRSELPGPRLGLAEQPEHGFALLFQRYRLEALIEMLLPIGRGRAADELRIGVWQAQFSSSPVRYERSLYRHMHRVPLLIAGPVGTPVEAVARVLALSGYVPWDGERLRFTQEPALHVRIDSALDVTPELLRQIGLGQSNTPEEAALGKLGYWVIRDIDRLEPVAQYRLYLLLEDATKLGPRLLSTTGVDLGEAVSQGRFREDLYHMLAVHRVELPALSTQLRQRPDDLRYLVQRVLSPLLEGPELRSAVDEVTGHVEKKLSSHSFPGNQQELLRCAQAILLAGEYRPPARRAEPAAGPLTDLGRRFMAGDFDADGLLDAYCTLMYSRTGSYQESARRLGIDRRTVKSRVNEALLSELS